MDWLQLVIPVVSAVGGGGIVGGLLRVREKRVEKQPDMIREESASIEKAAKLFEDAAQRAIEEAQGYREQGKEMQSDLDRVHTLLREIVPWAERSDELHEKSEPVLRETDRNLADDVNHHRRRWFDIKDKDWE